MLKFLFITILISSSLSQNMGQFTKKTKNCQVGDKNIKMRLEMITKLTKSVREKAEKIFKFVRDEIKYTYYNDSKYGAVRTLKNKNGNCCDQTHLLIALLRTAGIPSRYKHGQCYFVVSKKMIGHIWAEAYVDKKWYLLDTTGPKNTFGKAINWSKSQNVKTYIELPF